MISKFLISMIGLNEFCLALEFSSLEQLQKACQQENIVNLSASIHTSLEPEISVDVLSIRKGFRTRNRHLQTHIEAGNERSGENLTWESRPGRYFAHGDAAPPPFEPHKTRLANFGIPGGSSADVLRLEISKAQAFKPDLSIVMAGTNDALNSNKLTSPEQYELNIRLIIQALQAAGSKVLLINLPPCVEEILLTRHKAAAYGDMPPPERILACNRILSDLAREFQLPLVDFHQIMMERGDLAGAKSLLRNLINEKSADGVHPTAEGYRLLAEAIAGTIKQHQLPRHRIACLGDSITYGAYMTGAGGVAGDTYPGQLAGMLE